MKPAGDAQLRSAARHPERSGLRHEAHPATLPDLHLFVGGGFERLDEHWRSENLLIARLGGSYVLHFGDRGRWLIAPQAFYDVVEGSGRDAVVFGVGFGLLF